MNKVTPKDGSFVCVINYGLGNLTSVSNALELMCIAHEISSSPQNIEKASHLILPGVGSFKEGIAGLEKGGWIEPIRRAVLNEGKRILGICLGMQLFADEGFENGHYLGLSLLPGRVEKIPIEGTGLALPHIGWNSVVPQPGHSIMRGIAPESDFYFVHSYRYMPEDVSVIAGVTDYGVPIAAVVEQGNIIGTQFHPEKSQDNGMRLLQNFIELE